MKRPTKNNKGAILAITASFILVFTMLGVSSIYLAGLQSQAIEKKILGTQAFWAAEAGLEKAGWIVENAKTRESSFNIGDITVNLDWTPDRVESSATVGGKARRLAMDIMPQGSWGEDNMVIASDVNINFQGNVTVSGNVGANGEIEEGLVIEDGEIIETDVLMTEFSPDFETYFRSIADKTFDGDHTFSPLRDRSEDYNGKVVFVDGDATINLDVDWWGGIFQSDKSLDITIVATGDIVVNSPINDNNDRLTLISQKDVTLKGAGIFDKFNGIIYAGDTFTTTGYTTTGYLSGGGGTLNGAVLAGNCELNGSRLSGWELNFNNDVLLGTNLSSPGLPQGMPVTLKHWREL